MVEKFHNQGEIFYEAAAWHIFHSLFHQMIIGEFERTSTFRQLFFGVTNENMGNIRDKTHLFPSLYNENEIA